MRDAEMTLVKGDSISIYDETNEKHVFVSVMATGELIVSIGSQKYDDDIQIHAVNGEYTKFTTFKELPLEQR